jgi:hypothetical protein
LDERWCFSLERAEWRFRAAALQIFKTALILACSMTRFVLRPNRQQDGRRTSEPDVQFAGLELEARRLRIRREREILRREQQLAQRQIQSHQTFVIAEANL